MSVSFYSKWNWSEKRCRQDQTLGDANAVVSDTHHRERDCTKAETGNREPDRPWNETH